MAHHMLLDLPSHFETERLLMRPYQAGDGPRLYDAIIRNREHLRRYESGNLLMEIDSQARSEIIARVMAADWMRRNNFFLGLWDKPGGAWAGQVYVGPVDWALPEFEIGYVVDADHEGRGLISEAVRVALREFVFGALTAHRVSLRCDDTNTRSIRVAERAGFTCEGHQRDNKRHPDGITGTYLYAMLRRDFLEKSGQ